MNVLDLPRGTIEDESILRHVYSANRHIIKNGFRQLWFSLTDTACLHRISGPAIIYSDGTELWYRDHQPYTPTAHEKMMWEVRKKNECS